MKPVRIKGAQKLQKFVKPMLATLTDRPAFDDPKWLFEIKWDGYRAVAELQDGAVNLYSRNGNTFNVAYPKIVNGLKKINFNCVLDGEIVVFDKDGKPSFQLMQNYSSTSNIQIQYFVFDVLSVSGKDVTGLPLKDRKELAKSIIPQTGIIVYCDHVEAQGVEFDRQVKKMGLEGIIAKKADSKYVIGQRSNEWLKIKNVKTCEAVIVGFSKPGGSRQYFGALLIGAYNDKRQLISIGSVGTGFTDMLLKDLHAKLSKHVRKSSAFDVAIPASEAKDVTWVNPTLVCEVQFTEITSDGHVRHPSYLGLRHDKSPNEVTI
jgi:bifunctional non-homologous end joining protein LigD